jgi:hypothetical protein
VSVVDIFDGGLMLEFGIVQEAFEPEIFPVGLFILDQ